MAELSDFPTLPPNLRAIAIVPVSVPQGSGLADQPYKSPLLAGPPGPTGPQGQGFNVRGAWAPQTTYAPYDVAFYGGQTYVTLTGLTSGTSFSANGWVVMAQRGADGAGGAAGTTGTQGPPGALGPQGQGFTYRGNFASGQGYAAYDVVTYAGSLYLATVAFVAGGAFNPANWSLLVAKGADGASGPGYTQVQLTNQNHLVFTKTDGTVVDLGSIQGPQGAQGPPGVVTPAGTSGQLQVNSAGALGAMPAVSGDATLNTSTGAFVVTKTAGAAFAPVATSGAYGDLMGKPAVPTLGTATPIANGTGAPGTAPAASHEDHVHPTDASRLAVNQNLADVANAAIARTNLGLARVANTGAFADLTGAPSVPNPSTTVPAPAGVGSAGTGATFARGDHVHPTDPTRLAAANNLADLPSPATARSNLGLAAVAATGSFTDLLNQPPPYSPSTASTTVAGVLKVDGSSIVMSNGIASAPNTGSGVQLAVAGTDPAPVAAGTAAVGGSVKAARNDHVHPTDASRLGAAANLADLGNVASARSNLGLGAAALLAVGTAAGTVAAGNDGRLVGALQASSLGAANGVASLGSDGKVPTAQLPAAVGGGVTYVGAWNASTNSPALASGSGSKGSLYTVSVAGSTTLDGINQWNAGDHAIFNGTVWEKFDGLASEVITVAGRTGNVTLTATDVGGLGGAATLNVGTAVGTVAAGNDSRLAGALQASALPAATGGLFGGSGTAGQATPIALGVGFSISTGTLNFTYTLPVATASVLGGVKAGTGVTIAADGTISATGTSGVSTFNTRSGAITLTSNDVATAIGTGSTAKTNLGLANVASSGAYSDLSGAPAIPAPATVVPLVDGTAAVGTATTYARTDHVHPTDATREALANKGAANGYAALGSDGKVPSAQLPASTGSGFGTPQTITASGTQAIDPTKALVVLNNTTGATNLTLAAGATDGQEFELVVLPTTQFHTLAGTFLGTSQTLPVSSPNVGVALVFKWSSAQSSWYPRSYVGGTKVTDLTDVSSGGLGGPALSDIDSLNRGGADYKTTLAARAALFRKTPAASRTVALAAGSTTATLTAADNDRIVVVSGIAGGSLTVDGTITDGFACRVRNRSSGSLTVSGITLVGGLLNVPATADVIVSLANATTEGLVIDGQQDITAATSATPAGPDLFAFSQGGTLKSTSFASLIGTHAVTVPITSDQPLTTTPIDIWVPNANTILTLFTPPGRSIAGGTFNLTVAIAGTAVTGMNNVAVGAGALSLTATAANTIPTGGALVTITASSITGTPTGTLVLTRQRT